MRDVSKIPQTEYINAVRNTVDKTGKFPSRTYMALGKGVCYAACAYYLKNKLRDNGNFWEWMNDFTSKWAIISTYLDTNYNMLPPVDVDNRVKGFLATHLEQVNGTILLSGSNINSISLCDFLQKSQKHSSLGRLCVLESPEKAHAIAFVNYSKPRLFDPNIGEIEFADTRDFRDWMAANFAEQYRKFSNVCIYSFN